MKHGICEVRCEDGFKILANAVLASNISAAVGSTQIGDILDDISWPAGARDIETSDTTFQSIVTEAAYALDTLRLVADSEAGGILMDPAGKVRFWDDSYLDNLTRELSLYGRDVWAAGTTIDDTQIYNKVLVQPINKAIQSATDATSVGKYGPRTLARYGTVHNSTGDASTSAAALLADYKDPSVRLRFVELKPDVDPWLWEQIARVDLGDLVQVAFTPPGSVEFDTTDHVEGIVHSWSAEDGEWRVELRTTPSMMPTSDDGSTLARLISPGSLPAFVLAQDLQSDNYASGSAGWKIERDTGDVEFNDGTFRGELSAATGTFSGALSGATGTFAGSLSAATGSLGSLSVTGTLTLSGSGKLVTAGSGQRIEITATNNDRINFYTGNVGETTPGFIEAVSGGLLKLWSPVVATEYSWIELGPSGIDMWTDQAADWTLGGDWVVTDAVPNTVIEMDYDNTDFDIGNSTYDLTLKGNTIEAAETIRPQTDGGTGTIDLGDATKTWRRVYTYQIRDAAGNLVMNVNDLGTNHGQITTGVPDSGGSGFRLLRVPN
jgi:hypothetical protein